MSNFSKYNNLICVQAGSPDDLIKALKAIPHPSSILTGSFFTRGLMHGCYVMLDRPAMVVKSKDIQKTGSKTKVSDGNPQYEEKGE